MTIHKLTCVLDGQPPFSVEGGHVNELLSKLRPVLKARGVAAVKAKCASTELSDAEWLSELSKQPCYSHINVLAERGRAVVWFRERKRQCTRRAFINWLNRIPAPMKADDGRFTTSF